jgi:mono/diheme cytochrome c family protein
MTKTIILTAAALLMGTAAFADTAGPAPKPQTGHRGNSAGFFSPFPFDQQIADVVNYVRSHFGNKYHDKVKPADVKLQRE